MQDSLKSSSRTHSACSPQLFSRAHSYAGGLIPSSLQVSIIGCINSKDMLLNYCVYLKSYSELTGTSSAISNTLIRHLVIPSSISIWILTCYFDLFFLQGNENIVFSLRTILINFIILSSKKKIFHAISCLFIIPTITEGTEACRLQLRRINFSICYISTNCVVPSEYVFDENY